MNKRRVILSRPRDRSFEAYKEWMTEFSMRLLGPVDETITDEEWKEYHKQFWESKDKHTLVLDDSNLIEEYKVKPEKDKE